MREPVIPLADDIRWHRLMRTGFVCTGCGERHKGLFDLAVDAPAHWTGKLPAEPNSAVDGRTDVLTDDFCVVDGQHYFVRCMLYLPIVGSSEHSFGYGVWSSLSEKNFLLYCDTFDSGDQGDLGPWFGWFSNRLPGYPNTLGLKCNLSPKSDHHRPLISLEPTDHPLAVEQHEGITLDRILELYTLTGHHLP